MSREKKVANYLRDANRMEEALSDVLASRIQVTERSAYRNVLRLHLGETRNHAKRTQQRLSELDRAGSPIEFSIGLLQSLVGQALAIGRTPLAVGRAPLELLRGRGGAEKLLKDAKDDCATVALEIATYTAIEHLARSLGDAKTAKLAASIRADEEKMLDLLIGEIPALSEAIASTEPSSELPSRAGKTRAGSAKRTAPRRTRKPAASRSTAAKRSSRPAPRAKRPSSQTPGGAKPPTRHPAPATSAPGSEPQLGGSWPSYEERQADEISSTLARSDERATGDGQGHEAERESRRRILDSTEHEFANTYPHR